MDWKLLLAKYVAHVAAAEGPDFALSENLAPCGMLNLEFTDDEKLRLREVFEAVRKWEKTLTPTQREPLSIDQLFTPNHQPKEKFMERCKTCKHWEKQERAAGEVPGSGKCKAVLQFWSATEWYDGDKRKLKAEYAGRLAFVQDDTDYYAELKTLQDFGCVQHEGT